MRSKSLIGVMLITLVACVPSYAPAPTTALPLMLTPTSVNSISVGTRESVVTPIVTQPLTMPALVSFYIGGGDGGDEILGCLSGFQIFHRFVLYENGEIVIFQDKILKSTFLSQSEMEELMAQITDTGILEVTGTGKLGVSDPIYLNPPINFPEGGHDLFLSIREKSFTIYGVLQDYTVLPIRETLEIIGNYVPSDLQPYFPDSLIVYAFKIPSTGLGFTLSTPPAIQDNWPRQLPALADLSEFGTVIDAPESLILDVLFQRLPGYRIFLDGDTQYFVEVCPYTVR